MATGDVHERRRRDDASWELALEAGSMGTWAWDLGTGELDWDRPLRALFGVGEVDDVDFDRYLSLLHPEDREATAATIAASIEAAGEHYVEHRVVRPDGTLRWISGRGRCVLDESGRTIAMVGVGADITARKTAELRLEFLARAGETLGSSLDLDVTLQQLCDLAVERLADWCSVDLVEDEGVRLVAVSHRDPAKVAYARTLRERLGVDMDAQQGLPVVLRTGRPEVIPEITDDLLRSLLSMLPGLPPEDMEQLVALGLRSSVTVPLATPDGRVIGGLTLVAAESGRRYGDDDVELAMEVARRAAVAVENARLYSRTEHAARVLQQSLLPPALPDVAFAELASYYAPAGTGTLIGGDFYDAWTSPDDTLCLVVGDVSGKGIDAAALTAECRWTLRSSLTRTGDPARALDELNDALLRRDQERFVTVVAAVLRPADGERIRLSWAAAGHPAPVVVRNGGGAHLLGTDGQIIGVLPGPVATSRTDELLDGDTVLLYSDGFTEARRGGRLFGDEGMVAAADGTAGASAATVVTEVTAAVAAFGEQRDDMALLVAMARLGVTPPRQPGARPAVAAPTVDAG